MESLPVFQNVSSDFTINFLVENTRVQLRFMWNILTGYWMVNEYLEPDTGKRATGIKVIPEYPLTENITKSIQGALVVFRTDKNVSRDITYENFGKGWDLFYLTPDEYEEWEDLVGLST